MNYNDKELRDIYEKKLYLIIPELKEYQVILAYIFSVAPLFGLLEETRMGNFKLSYQFIRELLNILNGIEKKDISLITPNFLEYICFEEYMTGMPSLDEFKSIIVPKEMSKENIINYIISCKRVFGASANSFNASYYHNSDYHDFSSIIEYYKDNNDNSLIEYICFYFYANKEKYQDNFDVLAKMLWNYLKSQEEYDSLLILLIDKNVWNFDYFYKKCNIEDLYNILENIIVPKLLEEVKTLRKR